MFFKIDVVFKEVVVFKFNVLKFEYGIYLVIVIFVFLKVVGSW